jgi:hypothetical protein
MTLERRFQMVEDIIVKMTDELSVIQQTPFEQCFQKLKRQWEWYITD